MNNNVVFENEYVESVSFAGETIFFTYEPSPLDIEPMWDVGSGDCEDENVLSELGIYNIQ